MGLYSAWCVESDSVSGGPTWACGLQLDLRAHLHHAIGRQAEEIGGGARVARQKRKQHLSPARHPAIAGHEERLPPQIKARRVRIALEPQSLHAPQGFQYIWILHE